ncbi:MAG TPA: nucleotidyltransferase domain-containing protein [Candidatus Nanoarchaeia archaeon]|nr:nucleotidyltransferase domain-containing protein [Candidatus Nanoarchaeia archaeon]
MVNEKLSILRLLIESQEVSFNIRKISLLRKINYKSAYNAIKALEKEQVITARKIGNTTECYFNKNFNPSVFTVEHLRREELLKNIDFKVIYKKLSRIKKPLIAILFGSYANKTATKHSDIDILSISDSPEDIEKELSLLALNIHHTGIRYEDFQHMLKSKELSVVSEAVKKNILLVGIEEYYRLIQDAQ